jgi:uncharacterized membrane protein
MLSYEQSSVPCNITVSSAKSSILTVILVLLVNLITGFMLFLAYFPYFEKVIRGLRDHLAVCVSVFESPSINF